MKKGQRYKNGRFRRPANRRRQSARPWPAKRDIMESASSSSSDPARPRRGGQSRGHHGLFRIDVQLITKTPPAAVLIKKRSACPPPEARFCYKEHNKVRSEDHRSSCGRSPQSFRSEHHQVESAVRTIAGTASPWDRGRRLACQTRKKSASRRQGDRNRRYGSGGLQLIPETKVASSTKRGHRRAPGVDPKRRSDGPRPGGPFPTDGKT